MSGSQQTRKRVTYSQLLNLWEFLKDHRDIAVGYNKSAQAREHSKRMWDRVATIMNSAGEGPTKSGSEWSKYWVDLKAKLKRKNRMIRDARSGTGGGPSTEQELTEIELKFLQLLGEDYGSGLPGVQVLPVVIEEVESRINPIISQPSTDGTEEPMYLDINFDDFENDREIEGLQTETPVPVPTLITEPIIVPTPDHISMPSPHVSQEPSGSNPSRPVTTTDHNVAQRRRQIRQRRLTAGEARERLVVASETRAQAELANSSNIQKAICILTEISLTLKRMERRMPGAAPTDD